MAPAASVSRGLLLVLAIALVALVPLLASAQQSPIDLSTYRLKLLQVVHRHGARSPVTTFNDSIICGDFACGQLNIEGRQMLLNAGTYLREEYGASSSHAFLSDQYDPVTAYSRSTDMDRTLQSASALLRMLFPARADNSDLAVIHSRDLSTDFAMLPYNAPATTVRAAAEGVAFEEMMSAEIQASLTDDTIQQMAREAYMEGYCNDPARTVRANRVQCFNFLFDVGAAFRSRGNLGSFPTLSANFPTLEHIQGVGNKFNNGYNASDAYDQQRGSPGYLLAQMLVSNMRSTVAGTNAYNFMHYSGHDLTIAPLSSAFGDSSIVAMMPPYASTIIVELLESTTNGKPVARVLRGKAGLTPDTGFAFTSAPFTTLQCKSASGAVYTATDGVCLLDDLARFVDSTAPRSTAGSSCYVTDKYREWMACPAVDSSDAPSSICATYRNNCPQSACPGGSFLSEDGSARCISLASAPKSTSKGNPVSSGGAVGIAIGSCVAGLLIGALVYFACLRKSEGKSLNGSEHQNSPDRVL